MLFGERSRKATLWKNDTTQAPSKHFCEQSTVWQMIQPNGSANIFEQWSCSWKSGLVYDKTPAGRKYGSRKILLVTSSCFQLKSSQEWQVFLLILYPKSHGKAALKIVVTLIQGRVTQADWLQGVEVVLWILWCVQVGTHQTWKLFRKQNNLMGRKQSVRAWCTLAFSWEKWIVLPQKHWKLGSWSFRSGIVAS